MTTTTPSAGVPAYSGAPPAPSSTRTDYQYRLDKLRALKAVLDSPGGTRFAKTQILGETLGILLGCDAKAAKTMAVFGDTGPGPDDYELSFDSVKLGVPAALLGDKSKSGAWTSQQVRELVGRRIADMEFVLNALAMPAPYDAQQELKKHWNETFKAGAARPDAVPDAVLADKHASSEIVTWADFSAGPNGFIIRNKVAKAPAFRSSVSRHYIRINNPYTLENIEVVRDQNDFAYITFHVPRKVTPGVDAFVVAVSKAGIASVTINESVEPVDELSVQAVCDHLRDVVSDFFVRRPGIDFDYADPQSLGEFAKLYSGGQEFRMQLEQWLRRQLAESPAIPADCRPLGDDATLDNISFAFNAENRTVTLGLQARYDKYDKDDEFQWVGVVVRSDDSFEVYIAERDKSNDKQWEPMLDYVRSVFAAMPA